VSDTTGGDSSNTAGYILITLLKRTVFIFLKTACAFHLHIAGFEIV
jgi:hypothetical protein